MLVFESYCLTGMCIVAFQCRLSKPIRVSSWYEWTTQTAVPRWDLYQHGTVSILLISGLNSFTCINYSCSFDMCQLVCHSCKPKFHMPHGHSDWFAWRCKSVQGMKSLANWDMMWLSVLHSMSCRSVQLLMHFLPLEWPSRNQHNLLLLSAECSAVCKHAKSCDSWCFSGDTVRYSRYAALYVRTLSIYIGRSAGVSNLSEFAADHDVCTCLIAVLFVPLALKWAAKSQLQSSGLRLLWVYMSLQVFEQGDN